MRDDEYKTKNMTPEMPSLGGTRRDSLVAISKGVIGAIPYIGSILAEVVGQIIPEQRIEKLEAYSRLLADRLSSVERDELNSRFHNPENIDLFEEGAFQAARALSEARKEYIANVVAHGIAGDEKDRLESKRLLTLLREIDDAQVITLASYLSKYSRDPTFHQTHAAILNPVAAHMGSDQDTVDAETMQDAADQHLTRLGLLRPRFRSAKKNQLPEFDERTGMIKASGYQLTSLGRMLLRHVGLAGPEDV
jgi:hypothetical protein